MRYLFSKALFFSLLLYPALLIGQMRTGAERTEIYLPLLENNNVAICGNQTSRIGNIHLVDTLFSLDVKIVKVFAPEHGFRGDAEAGAHILSGKDSITGLPVISLYGNNKKPTPEQMKDVDVLIFDIQDVGCRFYTYISTLHYIMDAALDNNVKVIILDRPNPNGYFVDGPILEEKFQSFVGMHPIPIVHGMTIGEYALMLNGENWLKRGQKCDLEVIAMEGYNHNMRYSLPYYPSPNLKTDISIFLYPSLCLFEGTDISIGRGTDIPFQVYGHPELSGGDYFFTPQSIKKVSENPPQKGKKCRGYNLTNFAQKRLNIENSLDLSFLINAYQLFPDKSKFFTHALFFDKLAGNSTLRWQIINGKSESEIRESWQKGLKEFKTIRTKYLLYPDFE